MARKRGLSTQFNPVPKPRFLRSGRDMNTPIASFNEANLPSRGNQLGRSRGSQRLSGQPQSIQCANGRRQSIGHNPSLDSQEGPSIVVPLVPLVGNGSQLIHHDGFGTRVDGLGTPSIAQESETSHAPSGYGEMPPIGGLSGIHSDVAPGWINADTFYHCREPNIPNSQVVGNGNTNRDLVVTPARPHVLAGSFSVRPRESSSSDDDDSSAIAATPGQGGAGVEMMNVYLGAGTNRRRVQIQELSSNDDEPIVRPGRRANASRSVESPDERHENQMASIERNLQRPQSVNNRTNGRNSIDTPIPPDVNTIPRRRQRSQECDGDQVRNVTRRSRSSQQVNSRSSQGNSRENFLQSDVDLVQPNDRGDANPLEGTHSSRNKSIFSYSKRISDLVGDERSARSEYERNRKREWRAKRKAMTGESSRTKLGRGSISFVARPQLQLFEGMPYSHSHTNLVRELSKIVRSELKSFRYVDATREGHVTKEEVLKIHNLLGEKYENGKDLDFQWTRLHLSSSLRNWRTTQRGIVADYLATLSTHVENPSPPLGVSAEEFLVYSKQLADEDYKQTHETMSKMATSMVEKRGCANPLGSGGVQRANAHYIMHKGKVPSIDEVKAWKIEAYETYSRRRSSEGNVDKNVGEAIEEPVADNAVGDKEDMGPDWNHPFNGPKAFFDRYVQIFGWNPTDDEISSWLSNGRPPLHV